MSLTGSVEDLPLLEILQVVAFCQKTGHLTVRAPEGDAAIVFQEGRVVSGFVWDVPPLDVDATATAEARQELIRERITSILQRLVRLRQGQFGFNVSGTAPQQIGDRDLAGETLDDGIHPEGLMLDLARQLDEDRRESSAALEASFSPPLPPAPACSSEEPLLEDLVLEEPSESPAHLPVLLVDDEPDVLRLVGERLRAEGFEVVEAADARGGRREAARLAQAGRPFLLVTDLGLPSLSGSNFRGGLEVVSYAAAFDPRPRILLMAERADEQLRKKARRLGVSILALKPGLSKLDAAQYESDLRTFGERLARDLVPRLQERSRTTTDAPPPAPPPAEADDEAARAAALRDALDELEGHPEPDQVAFLLLRAARAFLPRAVLFLVKDDQLRGLSGFGPTGCATSLDVLARELRVSLDEPSPFVQAVAPGHPWSGSPPAGGPGGALVASLGPLGANAAVVVPVRAQQATIAVVYGDNPGGRPLPAVAPFLAFADRAGRALDEAFLAQRLERVPV